MIALLILLLILALLGMLLVRNNMVYDYNISLLERIHQANLRDIDAGLGFDGWRYKEFDKVGYTTMLLQFWRRFKSFYESTKLEKELL